MSKLNRMLLILMIEKAKAELVNGHNVLTVHARKISHSLRHELLTNHK